MDNRPLDYNYSEQGAQVMARTFMASVFSWMFLALTITGIIAYLFGTSIDLVQYMIDPMTGKRTLFGYVVMFAPLGFVLLMGLGYHRLSKMAMIGAFLIFSVLMGMGLFYVFLIFKLEAIYLTFGICSGMFGLMAVLGYTTRTDLTKFGSIMMMGLAGIILASIVNFFANSDGLYYLISFGGVIVFTGLTAYDVQKLKRIGAGQIEGSEDAGKQAIMGALTLYLDFINLFLFLLRLFGNSRR